MTQPRTIDCETVRDLAPLYVLGALDAAEAAAIREHLAHCDDVHAELQELAEDAGSLLLSVEPADPPAAVRSRLLAAAESDLRDGRHPSVAAGVPVASDSAGDAEARDRPLPPAAAPAPSAVLPPAAASVPPATPARNDSAATPAGAEPVARSATPPVDLRVERERRRLRWATLGAAAAILLAFALGGYALTLRGQLADEQAYRQAVDQALQLAAEPGSATAVLAGAANASAGLGVIGADGRVELAMRGLSSTPGREVYTAWAIGPDGKPRSLGDFEVGGAGTGVASGTSPVTGAGTVLAVTREPGPGATTPTLPIVASGSATSASG